MDMELRRGRMGRISGSVVAAIFGIHQFLTRFGLYYNMKVRQGAEDPPDIRMVVGKAIERPLVEIVYPYLTGRETEYSDQTVVDPVRPYMMSTPDGFCKKERRGVEAKVVMWDQIKNYGDGPNDLPFRVVLQCDWYMAQFDMDRWDVLAYRAGEPYLYELERDRESERYMLERVREWHARYIVGDEVPPLDSSDEARRWLQEVYPTHKRPDLREADEAEVQLLNEYVTVRLAQRSLKAQQVQMETALKAAVKDREGLVWADGKFTWRKTKDGEETDWQSLATGLLYGCIKDDQARADMLASYTAPKPGYRKVRIDHPSLRKGAHDEEEVTA